MDIESITGYEQALRFQQNPDAGDKHLGVKFYTDEIEDKAASVQAGHTVYKTVECVEIWIPGERAPARRGPCKSMKPDPRERFPEAYAKFKAGQSVQIEGMLLREWSLMPRATAKTYEALGVHTVEQLAKLSDIGAQNMPGSVAWRQKALDWVEMTKGLAPLEQARKELAAANEQIAALREQVSELASRMDGVPAPKRRRKNAAPETGD